MNVRGLKSNLEFPTVKNFSQLTKCKKKRMTFYTKHISKRDFHAKKHDCSRKYNRHNRARLQRVKKSLILVERFDKRTQRVKSNRNSSLDKWCSVR